MSSLINQSSSIDNRQSAIPGPRPLASGPRSLFACLFIPQPPATTRSLVEVAREFSPRVEVVHDWLVLLDVGGLGRLIGHARAIGLELGRAALRRGWVPRVAVASTRVTAWLLAQARPGLTVVPPGDEARALAPLPVSVLEAVWALGDGRWALTGATEVARAVLDGGSAGLQSGPVNVKREMRRAGRRGASSRHYRLAPGPLLTLTPVGAGFSRPKDVRGSAGPQSSIVNPQSALPSAQRPPPSPELFAIVRRWGVRTLGELAALPPADLSARLGPDGPALQRIARGDDPRPLVPVEDPERFEASFDLEWPIEGLEPLSFVLARVLEPLCARLERAARGAVALTVRLALTTRAAHERTLHLPAPLRDPRVLRTLALLDLESHPPPAGIDRVTVRLDPAPGRVTQFSLIEYPRPSPEQLSTLVARLDALMGEGRAGAPVLVDTHRPGAFAMEPFDPERDRETNTERTRNGHGTDTELRTVDRPAPSAQRPAPGVVRRFRVPLVARVVVENERPVRVTTGRRGLAGGRIDQWAGPWRTSGAWWSACGPSSSWDREEWSACGQREARVCESPSARERGWGPASTEGSGPWDREEWSACGQREARVCESPSARERGWGPASTEGSGPWDREEWDVLAADGVVYRLFRDRTQDRWFVEGVID